MEDEVDIALLRREALSSISTKGPRYGMNALFSQHEHSNRKPVRGRRITSPDITREVLGAFGIKPSASRQYMKGSRSKARSQPKRKSTMSSRSRSSESRSYSSYSSSSHSRSRSSSSSSNHSSYSRSSSYSGSSRSRSPRYDQLTPPHKTKRKVPCQAIPRSSSDKLLERHHRKKPRYTEDLSPPPDDYYHDSHSHRRISKNNQFVYSRKKSADRIESMPHHSYSKPTRKPERSDNYYHQSRHQMDRHRMPRPVHHSPPPPHYSHRLPPLRSHIQKDRHYRQRPTSYDSGKYYGSKASHLEPIPRHRNRSGYHEEEHSSLHRQPPPRPHQSSSRGNGHDDHRSSSEITHSHEIKERFIVVEESSYPEESQPNRKSSGKQSSHRQDSSRGARDTTPDHTLTEKHALKQKLFKREPETRQHASDDNEPMSTELISTAVKSAGDDSFAEELDYNEDMDNLDLHPRELLDVRVDEVLEEDSLRDKSQQSPSWPGEESAKEIDVGDSRHSRTSSDGEEGRPISSPLRVSPERSGRKEESWSIQGKMPVKQRLYLSKQKIEEKKRSARHHSNKSPSELRPSLANRLGPPHHSRHGSQRGFRRQWASDVPAKGSAMAIAEAYRKRKEAEKKVVLLRSHKGDKSGVDK